MKPFFSFCTLPFRAGLAAVLLFAASVPVARADEIMRQVQEELRRRNLYFGDINGLYSPQVAAALRRYQQRKGFDATGQADGATLRSLSLTGIEGIAMPPVGTPFPVATASTTPILTPGEATGSAWPDLPVLRSDQGRENPEMSTDEPAELDPTPSPPPKPPPAAAFENNVSGEKIQSFVEDFLKRGESNTLDAQQDFFAGQVDYFNEGKVDKAFIARDTARYNKRWPVRRFSLVGPIQMAGTDDVSVDRLVVNFRCAFDVKQSGHENKDPKEVKGVVENTYTLLRGGPDQWQIVSIKEQRVRGK